MSPSPEPVFAPLLAVSTAALSFFLVTLNASLVTTALPAIGRDLGGGAAAAWVLTGYSLALAAFLLPAGAWSDRIGARRVFRAGMALFAGTSVACALTGTLSVVLTARVVQGAAAAAVLPAGLAMLSAALPEPAHRAKAVGWWSAAGAVALVIGSPLGGAITTAFGWRATFWVNAAAGLAILLTASMLPAPVRPPAPAVASPASRRPGAVDRRAVVVGAVTGFAVNFASYGAIFALTLHLQIDGGLSAWTTGLVFVPMSVLIIPANLATGRLTARYDAPRVLVAGQVLMLTGLLGLVTAPTPPWPLVGWLLPLGLGAGLAAPAMTTLMLAGVPDTRAGSGAGLLNAARQVGSAAAPGVFGMLLGAGATVAGLRVSLVIAVAVVVVSGASAAWLSLTGVPGRRQDPAG